MNSQLVKVAAAVVAGLGVIFLVGSLRNSPRVQAQDTQDNETSLIRIGFEIAPVPLNLEGKNRDLVGLGSFIVNGQSDCNGCHTGGGPPNFNYAAGGTPTLANGRKQIPPRTWREARTSALSYPQVSMTQVLETILVQTLFPAT